MTVLVAQVAVATGISPLDLMDTPPHLFRAMVKVLEEKAKRAKSGK
jgi:hypothetical protein